MVIYLLEALWIIFCAPIRKIKLKIDKREIDGDLCYLLFVFIPIGFIMAMRAPSVGTDTQTYYNIFSRIRNAGNLIEAFSVSTVSAPIYVTYVYLVSKIFKDAQVITAMNSAIIIIGMCAYIYKTSKNVMFSSFLFLGLTLSLESMNGARQFMAIVLVLNAFLYFKESVKSKKGWFLFFIALGIHNTAVIFLVAIAGIILAKKAKTLHSIFLTSLVGSIIFGSAFYLLITTFLKYFPHYRMYTDGSNPASILNNSGGGRIVILYLALLAVLVVYYFYTSRLKGGTSVNQFVEIPVAIFCVVTGIMFCRNNLYNRILWYFLSMFVSFIPNTYANYTYNIRRTMYVMTFLGLGSYYLMHLMENKGGIVPYAFFWSR